LAGDEPLDVDTQKKLDLANYITEEQAKDPSLKSAYLENKWKDINKYDSSTDSAKVIGEAVDGVINSGKLDVSGYESIISAAGGDEGAAFKALKSRVQGAEAGRIQDEYLQSKGWDEETIRIKKLNTTQEELIENGGDKFAFSQLLKDLGEDEIREAFLYKALASNEVQGEARTFLQSKLADMLRDTNQFELRSVGNTLLSVNPNTNESSVIFQGEEKDDAFTTQQKFSNTMSIRRDYQTQSKNFTLTRDNFNKIKALSNADDFTTGASDISLVFSYMKMLDPTSVVRDTEFATAANSGGVPAAVLNTYNRLREGQFLTPVQRADFTKAAKGLFREQLKVQQDRQAEFRATAESFDLDPEKSVPDYVSGFERDEMSDLIDTEPSYTSADLSALGVEQSQVDGLTPEAQTSFNEAMGDDQGADMIDALLRDGLTLPLAIQIYQEEPKSEPVGTGKSNTDLLELIGEVEAQGNYNAIFGNGGQDEIDYTAMTLDEVAEAQKAHVTAGNASSAIGKYQFIQGTLKGLRKDLGLKGDEKFTPELQDELAQALLRRRGLDKYLKGDITAEQFQANLAKEWASLPSDSKNKSYYDGDGLNKARTDTNTLLERIKKLS